MTSEAHARCRSAFCDFGHLAFEEALVDCPHGKHWEDAMKNLFGLLLALALAAGAATLITPYSSAATPILPDYSGATY